MLTIVRFGNARAVVYASMSRTRMVRLIVAEHSAEISTTTLEITNGYVPREVYEVFKAWAVDHMIVLDEAWTLLNG